MGRSVPRSIGWIGLTALVAAAGCQAILGLEEGKPLPAGTGGGTTTTTTTTTTTGGGEGGIGGGGGGGSGGLGGQGGQGGSVAPTCTDGAQNGDEAGVDCGGSSCAPCPLLLLLGGGGATVLGGAYHPTPGWSTTTVAGGNALSRPALAWSSAGEAVGLIQGASNELQFATWRQPDTWSALAGVGPGISTRSAPSLDAGPSGAIAVFQGLDYKHFFGSFTAGMWMPSAEMVGNQSFGPLEASIAWDGAEAVVAFINGFNGTNDLFVRRRGAGGWGAEEFAATDTTFNKPPPRIVALDGGPNLLIVYLQDSSTQIRYARWNGASWTTGAVSTATSTARPSVAPIAGGGAVVGFQGVDGNLYASIYDGMTWSSPEGIPGPAAAVLSPPAVAPGVGDADAELAYVTSGGVIHHARRRAGAWEVQPMPIDTVADLTHVTLASAPP